MSERIDKLKDAVQVMHRCTATHLISAPIIETFGAEIVWQGVVEVFAITGHPKAKRCYAWSFLEKGQEQFVNVLEIPPVDSPQTAVRAAILAQSRGKM